MKALSLMESLIVVLILIAAPEVREIILFLIIVVVMALIGVLSRLTGIRNFFK